jgi:curved DNA-binding protein CbpA
MTVCIRRAGKSGRAEVVTFYEDLNLPRDADSAAIESAWRSARSKHHPDREGGDEEKFKRSAKAYEILSNAERRKDYDEGRLNDQGEREMSIAELAGIAMQALIDAVIDQGVEGNLVTLLTDAVGKELSSSKELKAQAAKAQTAALKRARALHFKGKGDSILHKGLEKAAARWKEKEAHATKAIALAEFVLKTLREDYKDETVAPMRKSQYIGSAREEQMEALLRQFFR